MLLGFLAMKDLIKSFVMGIVFACGFFAAIHFTADDEDLAAEAETREFLAYQAGLTEGAKQATVNRPDQWRCMFSSKE
jgi:hypothetical protein